MLSIVAIVYFYYDGYVIDNVESIEKGNSLQIAYITVMFMLSNFGRGKDDQ